MKTTKTNNPKIRTGITGEGGCFYGYCVQAIVLTQDEKRFKDADDIDPVGKNKLKFGWSIMDYDNCYANRNPKEEEKYLKILHKKTMNKAKYLAKQKDVEKVYVFEHYDLNW